MLTTNVSCWSAELPYDSIVYDVAWNAYKYWLGEEEMKMNGCYVPKKSLAKIRNIQRIS